MNPANEYLYTGKVRKKSKVGIFFYSWKSVKYDFDSSSSSSIENL